MSIDEKIEEPATSANALSTIEEKVEITPTTDVPSYSIIGEMIGTRVKQRYESIATTAKNVAMVGYSVGKFLVAGTLFGWLPRDVQEKIGKKFEMDPRGFTIVSSLQEVLFGVGLAIYAEAAIPIPQKAAIFLGSIGLGASGVMRAIYVIGFDEPAGFPPTSALYHTGRGIGYVAKTTVHALDDTLKNKLSAYKTEYNQIKQRRIGTPSE